jgi:hypothetical protein
MIIFQAGMAQYRLGNAKQYQITETGELVLAIIRGLPFVLRENGKTSFPGGLKAVCSDDCMKRIMDGFID